jgi:hypothetical protein
MSYTLDWKPRGVVKHFSGFVTGAEFFRSFLDVTGSIDFDNLKFIINDFSNAINHSINQDTFEDIIAMRHGASNTRSNIYTAIITTDIRFVEIADTVNSRLPDGVPKTEVFPTLTLANEWIAKQSIC